MKTQINSNLAMLDLLLPSNRDELIEYIDSTVLSQPTQAKRRTSFRAAIYGRVSRVPAGVHSYSGEDVQPDETEAYVRKHGGVIVESLSDLDETGRNSRRKNIRKLIRLIKAGKIDTLVIYSLDRLYRNVESFAKFLGLLRQYNVRLVSISENFDTETPWGRLVMFVLAAMAEMFVRQTSVRTRSAIKARMQKGLPSGAYRFGYCNGLCSNCTDPNGPGYCPFVGETDQGDGRILIPHPIESHAVRLIVSLYRQGMSDKDIAEYLNSHTFEIHHGISS